MNNPTPTPSNSVGRMLHGGDERPIPDVLRQEAGILKQYAENEATLLHGDEGEALRHNMGRAIDAMNNAAEALTAPRPFVHITSTIRGAEYRVDWEPDEEAGAPAISVMVGDAQEEYWDLANALEAVAVLNQSIPNGTYVVTTIDLGEEVLGTIREWDGRTYRVDLADGGDARVLPENVRPA